MAETLLEIDDLRVEYRGGARAVDGVSFTVAAGEVFGLAGESGSGKSTLAHAVLRLLPRGARVTGGAIRFRGEDVLAMDDRRLRAFRWRQASLVLQSALNALNPVLTVGVQIADVLEAHEGLRRRPALARAAGLLERVGLDPARASSYPHQLSGGMRQRVVIAIAHALAPPLVILDEPTTALDVVVQGEILRELATLRAELGFAVLLVTHDLALLLERATRVAIMYAGRVVESAPARGLLAHARHPYTRGLLASFPSLDGPRRELAGIPGTPPDPRRLPAGCRFQPRCSHALARCTSEAPPLAGSERHLSACHLGHETIGEFAAKVSLAAPSPVDP